MLRLVFRLRHVVPPSVERKTPPSQPAQRMRGSRGSTLIVCQSTWTLEAIGENVAPPSRERNGRTPPT